MLSYPRYSILTCGVLLLATTIHAAPLPNMEPDAGQVVDRAITREAALLTVLRASTPVAETYIQDLVSDADFGTIPNTDHYFLGKLDLSRGLAQTSYLPKDRDGRHPFDLFTRYFTLHYLPKGFAQMMLIDGEEFDRDHYDFAFVRKEYLGDARTLVYSVTPRKSAGAGRFVGNIWIEDRGFNIVRFNGTYSSSSSGRMFLHFDSWRTNAGPDLWLPYEAYSEESHLSDFMKIHTVHFKALTKFWGYGGPAERAGAEFTSLTVETLRNHPQVEDKSPDGEDSSPVEGLRAWQHLSEENVLGRLERAGLVSKQGGIDTILDTVVNNIAVTNDLNLEPAVHVRVLLTTPLESFTIGRTIVISRGMIDTLPDEASLAAILTHELAHIILGHTTSTDFAFSDRVRFDDSLILERFRLSRTPAEEAAANGKAVQLLAKSPYSAKLGQAGLFLKALDKESNRLPSLIKPLMGDGLVSGHTVLQMAALMDNAPQLQTARLDQIAALPLGSRTWLDPWTDGLEMKTIRSVPLVSAAEKLPFEITPVYLHLRYQSDAASQSVEEQPIARGN